MPAVLRPRLVVAWILLAAACLSGCGKEYGVLRTDDTAWFVRENRSALNSDEPSERTKRYLRRHDLAERYADDPDALFADLLTELVEDGDRALAHHLAEIALVRADAHEGTPRSLSYLLAVVECSYAYLFDRKLGSVASPYDPPFRQACDLYNRALARVVPQVFDPAVFKAARARYESEVGTVDCNRGSIDTVFDPSRFSEVLSAYDYEAIGLSNPARGYGVGAPCIAVRVPDETATARLEDRFLPPIKQSFACTVVVRFIGSIRDRVAGGPRRALVDVYDPLSADSFRVDDRTVPLEHDLTTPLAYALDDAPVTSGFKAMLHVEEYEESSELFMSQPFDPNRIPVVFVHGLMSSPATWLPMFNELRADPVLRRRYQFWFFRYSTGNPVAWSAHVLRESLRTVYEQCDPSGTNRVLRRTVVCGHSMGGLLSKMLVHSSGDRLWERVTDTPLDDFDLSDETKALVRNALFFERVPQVQRVVFMATPHRGANLATSFVGRIGAGLITLPGRFLRAGKSLSTTLSRDPSRRVQGEFASQLTGIDSLRPGSPLLSEMAAWPFESALTIHSVIGNVDEAGVAGGSDGIVPYESAHVDGVASELIVKSDHSVQQHPLAILEVQRILHEHLEAR